MSTNKKIKKIISLIPKITQKDKLLIEKAYKFAKKAHKGHLRKSGEPYFIHAYETAKKLAELGMYPVVIAAGFLHDVIRDTKTTEEEVLNEFGEEIVKLILEKKMGCGLEIK